MAWGRAEMYCVPEISALWNRYYVKLFMHSYVIACRLSTAILYVQQLAYLTYYIPHAIMYHILLSTYNILYIRCYMSHPICIRLTEL